MRLLRLLGKVIRVPRKVDIRLLRKVRRLLRKVISLLRKAMRLLHKLTRLLRQLTRLLRKVIRLLRKVVRLLGKQVSERFQIRSFSRGGPPLESWPQAL